MAINPESDFPWLDEHAKAAIKDLYWNVVFNEIDAIFVITGRERFGKSMLSMVIWAYLDYLREGWGLNATIDIDNKIALVPEDYANLIDKAEGLPGDVVCYDEAGTGMYNRESMSKGNRDLNKILMTCGYKNLVHLLTLPNFFALDKEVRSRRVAALFVVTAHPRKCKFEGDGQVYTKLEKGWFRAYSAKDVQYIKKDSHTSRVHYPRTPQGNLRFKSLVGTELWAKYKAFSNKHKREYIRGVTRGIVRARLKKRSKDASSGVPMLDEFDEELELIEGNTI